ncbi:hypothetical protein [Candidatus Magnetomonas plexicatena]|uniref:hypothetical protein n=1 Tax=Candidatus Magnetomonas plexicatena TaxID=2552947 RepID=UPI001C792C4D|nr:hypothetical protein E2O03_013530 [Nitrospirales bacterium LBB_01]
MKTIVFLIVCALMLQNTCVYGFAAKTGFLSAKTHDCQLKKCCHNCSEKRDTVNEKIGKIFHQTFVLTISDIKTVSRCFPVCSDYVLSSSDIYNDPFPNLFQKPPAV